MNPSFIRVSSLLAGLALAAAVRTRAEEAPPPPGHEAHAGPAAANPAQAPDPKPESFIALDPAAAKTVNLVLISAYNDVNYGMNFNGFCKGRAKYVIPQGWTVSVTFTNNSPVPHSAIVVERAMAKRVQLGDPAFEGASTPMPLRGTTGKKGVAFRFVAGEAGDYAIACGFPAHSANGHWIALEVSATAAVPSLQFADQAAYVAK